jgi:Protein of unknown function (DUF1353)
MLPPYLLKRKCISVFRPLCLAVSLFFISYAFSMGGETQSNPELAERRIFIEKAMEEQQARTREAIQEMAKRGIHPKMSVTTLTPFADWDFYFVAGGSITWSPNPGQQLEPVNVPAGFVTDLTSIPRLFWQILRPEGRYAYASVVHDYLYWEQNRTREEADLILKIAMEDSMVDPATVETIYQAVRIAGQAAWDSNARMKKAGERRILKQFPDDYTISWIEWKKQPGVFAGG